MPKILIVSGHPEPAGSLANKLILNNVRELLSDAAVRELGALYPDGNFDVTAEQEALASADIIVLAFPLHWYSVPGLMKNWIDRVWLHGFAYGSKGDKLRGKRVVLSVTTGGPETAYRHDGSQTATLREILLPLRLTARNCGMKVTDYVASYGMLFIPGMSTDEDRARIERETREHARVLAAALSR